MKQLDDEIIRLLSLLAMRKSENADEISTAEQLINPDKTLYLGVKFEGDVESLSKTGFNAASVIGQVAFGSCKVQDLEKLVDHDQVLAVEKQRKSHVGLDGSIPDINANQVWSRSGDNFTGYTGEGVIVGIIDTGIDYTHESFRKPDSDKTSRILKIWDQTLTAGTGESAPAAIPSNTIGPNALGYGVEYNKAQIDDNLTNDSPTLTVRHRDEHSHGTHCAGIAAGNGMQNGNCGGSYNYIGVAPKADIIVVRKFGLTSSDSNLTPPSGANFTIDALAYIMNEALSADKPCVISNSYGAFNDFIDGTSSICTAIDTLLTNNSTKNSIVFLAHNFADKSFHARDTVTSGGSMTVTFRIMPGDTKARTIAIRYSGSNLRIRVTSPLASGNVVGWTTAGNSTNSTTANGSGGSVNISNNANRIVVSITPPSGGNNASNANWTFELNDTGSSATVFNAYFNGNSYTDNKASVFVDHVSVLHTICREASSNEVISVGSYSDSDGTLAASSGRGTTLDTPPRQKPEITAPGVGIMAAGIPENRDDGCEKCCCDCCADFHVTKSGTSMATPHVAGAVALMLQKNDTLTHTQIRTTLTDPANVRAIPGGASTDDLAGWGRGKLDVKAVIDAVSQVNPPSASVEARTVISHHPDVFTQLQEQVLGSERGIRFNLLFRKHLNEIRHLVNTNKKVATVWHRNRGPAWFRTGLTAVYNPEKELPEIVDGVRLTQGIANMTEILNRFGTAELVNDLQELQHELSKVKDGMSINQLVELIIGKSVVYQQA